MIKKITVNTGSSIKAGHIAIGLGVATALLLSHAARASILVGPVLNPGNGHKYFLLSQNSWSGAEAEAVSLGGHLATVRNPAENTWIFNTFSGYVWQQDKGLWMGLYDPWLYDGGGEQHAANFQWVSGEAKSYTPWAIGEPNNVNNTEYYGMIVVHHFGSLWPSWWNDVPNGADSYGVVEVVPVPEVASTGIVGAVISLVALLFTGRNKTVQQRQLLLSSPTASAR